jgi:hypothetical protein
VVYVHVLTASVALEGVGVRLGAGGAPPGAGGEGPRGGPGAPGAGSAAALGRVLWVFVDVAACGALAAAF